MTTESQRRYGGLPDARCDKLVMLKPGPQPRAIPWAIQQKAPPTLQPDHLRAAPSTPRPQNPM